MNYTPDDIDILEQWWVEKSRVNFFAYRQFMRYGSFSHNWFISDLSMQLQAFYVDFIKGKKPILIIQTPPQHGKSWAITDFIEWVIGRVKSKIRVIYSSFSGRLGIRCNANLQRAIDSEKYSKIFPDVSIPDKRGGDYKRTDELIELLDGDGNMVGFDNYFRNTTVGGPVTGESLDLGIIDDPVKGREQANSDTMKTKIWEWFTDDFWSRASENAGLILIMTRWGVDDLAGKIKEYLPEANVMNYKAIATEDEKHRNEGEALFPRLKSLDFLLKRKQVMYEPNFESLYQGSPTIAGGNIFKDEYWGWWEALPQIKYKFIVADTASKKGKLNDYTDFQCWGKGIDGRIYLLDHFHEKLEFPELEIEFELFYKKHNTKKKAKNDPMLRGAWVEDKSSGIALIQKMKRKKLKVNIIPYRPDKILRAQDTVPEIKAGNIMLNTSVNKVDIITKEARPFPEGPHDDSIDNVMNAVEVEYVYKKTTGGMKEAMNAD